MIAIIDYGMGNIHSVRKALELMGAKTLVTNKPNDIKAADKLVLPGVGAFADAMAELEKQGLIPAIKESVKSGKPFFGICLGMQILFEQSEEAIGAKGLSVLKGRVRRFENKKGFKVPHMGWNQLKIKYQKSNIKSECPLLNNIPANSFVYFCHSYYVDPQDKATVAASCDYTRDFCAVVWQDNVYGAQFHPEKSQEVGLKMLMNFVEM